MICELCPVPTLFLAKHTYVAASSSTTLKISNDGFCTTDPPYLLEFVLEVIVVVMPDLILCQYTFVAGGLAFTEQPRVTGLFRLIL